MIDEKLLIKRFKKLQGINTLASMLISDVIRVIKEQPKVDECFIPEPNNPYPLCIGKGMERCKECQLRVDWEPKDPYGVES